MTLNEYPTRLDICDGKYTLIIDTDTGRAECLRYEEKWRDLAGDKMVLALFDELVDARARAEAARAEAEALRAEVNVWRRQAEAYWAKIEQMERQKPVCVTTKAHLAAMENGAVRSIVGRDPAFAAITANENDVPLYALPGAKGE